MSPTGDTTATSTNTTMDPSRTYFDEASRHVIPADSHDAKADLDPTEWKPAIAGGFAPRAAGAGAGARRARMSPLASSEAWRYLTQFYGDEYPIMSHRMGDDASSGSSSICSESASVSSLPALTAAPSVGSSLSSSLLSDQVATEVPPLPPRHKPIYPASSSKGLVLVVPQGKDDGQFNSVSISRPEQVSPTP